MFTIDLLKGQGIPAKTHPRNIAVGAVAVVVPIIIAMVMYGYFLHNRIILSIKKNTIANYETRIDGISGALKLQKSFEKKISTYNNCLSEVASNLKKHAQWSPVLVTLVENLPDSVMLTSLDVKQRSTRIKVPKKDNPKIMIDVSVPLRTLQMKVAAKPHTNCDEAIKEFSDVLRSSSLLGPKLENIRIAQSLVKLGEQEIVSYQIDCTLKPGL